MEALVPAFSVARDVVLCTLCGDSLAVNEVMLVITGQFLLETVCNPLLLIPSSN